MNQNLIAEMSRISLRREMLYAIVSGWAYINAVSPVDQKELARRIGMDEERLTAILRQTPDVTLDEISDILMGLGLNMSCRAVVVAPPAEEKKPRKQRTEKSSKQVETHAEGVAVIPKAEVLKRTGFENTTLYRKMNSGDFPKGKRKPGADGRELYWDEALVDEWVRKNKKPDNLAFLNRGNPDLTPGEK